MCVWLWWCFLSRLFFSLFESFNPPNKTNFYYLSYVNDSSNPDAFFGEEDKDDEMSISDKFDGWDELEKVDLDVDCVSDLLRLSKSTFYID